MSATDPAPPAVLELVDRFRADAADLTDPGGRYNETQLRQDFLNPLFAALGWDVGNTLRPRTQARREVVQEATVAVDGRTRFPDYAFRLGGSTRFFVEAKQPSVKIEVERSPAFQTRSYGWSAKHPLAALTDFEEFALYDTRVPPEPGDGADVRRVLYVRYDQYADRWGEIAGTVSRDAVLDGRFDAYVAGLPGGRSKKTREVDDAFLADIERWREVLAADLAARNPGLAVRQLNFAVQATIDRLVFLRICEDRGLEAHGTLVGLLGDDAYGRLQFRFEEADAKYNSGLFHFRAESGRPGEPDALTPSLDVGDDALEAVILGLYENPYSFAVLPADILGQIYERFLGKVIRLPAGPGGGAVVEEKPEVRKAGGVYYTPTYIVDYIVERTVGELLEGRSVAHAERVDRRLDRPLRVLDPACGSGSFLLGAYQRLLDWYLAWYVAHDPEALAGVKNPPVRRAGGKAGDAAGGGWLLTTAERRRILVAHIYGVDVDAQAVEVSKLSLLLKVLEGDPDVPEDRLLAGERVLPDLGGNVKCGNSLIGTDIYDPQGTLFDAEDRLRINAFDWDGPDGFPGIMADGGFEAVVGNPPYIFGEYHDEATKDHIADVFATAADQFDTYWLFTEAALRLAAERGRVSLIVPDALLARDMAAPVRGYLLRNGLIRIYHCGQVFQAGVSATVFVCKKEGAVGRVAADVRVGTVAVEKHTCDATRFSENRGYALLIHATDEEDEVLSKLRESGRCLGDAISISRGEEIGKKNVLTNGPHPILVGEDVGRYSIAPPTRFVTAFKKKRLIYDAPKVVMVKTGAGGVAALDVTGCVTMQSLYNIAADGDVAAAKTLLAVLNSKLFQFFVRRTFTDYKLLFPQLNQSTIERMPLPRAKLDSDRLVKSVDGIAELIRQSAATPHQTTALRRQIDGLDRRIDGLVYELYGLTAEEIAVVEAATAE